MVNTISGPRLKGLGLSAAAWSQTGAKPPPLTEKKCEPYEQLPEYSPDLPFPFF